MLNQRRAELLGIVVHEYVDTAAPVGSESIVQKYALAVSPATVRNEMGHLEEEGYLTHPHTSAGRVPSDKGYRFFVESLMDDRELPPDEQRMIRHQFHQVARQIDEWIQLAAAVVAHTLGNAAMVTAPRTRDTKLRQLQLVGIQDRVALLVAVFEGGRVKQEMLTLEAPLDQEALLAVTTRLNRLYAGRAVSELVEPPADLTTFERQVVAEVARMLEEEMRDGGDAVLDGVREVLRQPEFSRGGKLMNGLDLLDERVLKQNIPFSLADGRRVVVLIGNENRSEAMHDWSVLLTRYGDNGGLGGTLAVLGPTRMEYGKAISTARYVSDVLSDLISGYYGASPETMTEEQNSA
jgi:heat-inducible transcriptional repressor